MTKEWFFVRKLRSYEQPSPVEQFEVQVLDDEGRAIAVGYLSEDTTELVIQGYQIPLLVLQAAKQRVEGQGDYIGPDGQSISPF